MPSILAIEHGYGPHTTVRRLDRQDLAGLENVIPPAPPMFSDPYAF